jgi:hypothetical protein
LNDVARQSVNSHLFHTTPENARRIVDVEDASSIATASLVVVAQAPDRASRQTEPAEWFAALR